MSWRPCSIAMSPVGGLLLASVLGGYWAPAGCFSNGKVTNACGSMEPRHGAHGQTTLSPYRLETNTSTFSPGDVVKVILTGTSSFKGFLLQARDAANQGSGATVGTFTLTDQLTTQLLPCSEQPGSAVSHTSDAPQPEVVVLWRAPADAPPQVHFLVTVVQRYNVFWVKLPGPIIYQHGVTAPPPPPATTPPPVPPTTPPTKLPGPFSAAGCGHSKSCLLAPPGCDPADPQCCFLSMTPDAMGAVMFELSGPAEGYVAFALSWDTWMGDDDVYMCVTDGGSVSVSAAVVSGRSPPEDQSQAGLSSVAWRLADGALQCRFSRAVKLTLQEPARYDLDRDYFLFLTSGAAQDGRVWKHSRQPSVSTHRKLITGPPELLRGSRGPLLLKMHGALMLLAWMLTGSVGTFIASFYKPDWPNQTLLGQKVWFQVHRGLMVLTVTLTVVAFCLPFFYRKGWSEHAGAHPYLGCCVLILSLVQPTMAAIRPSPDSHRRSVFNWAHWGLGSVTEVMAVAAMFLGMSQSSLPLPQPWPTSVLIGYVAWLASFRILFLIHKHLPTRTSTGSCDQAIISGQSEPCCRLGPSLHVCALGWVLKPLLLAALALGSSALMAALLSSLADA